MHERQISKSYNHNAITKIVTSCLIMTDMKIYAPCLDKCEWEKNPMRMIVRLKKGSNNASTRRAHHWSHEEYRAKKKKSLSYWRVKIIQKSRKKIWNVCSLEAVSCDLDPILFKNEWSVSARICNIRAVIFSLFILSFISNSFST